MFGPLEVYRVFECERASERGLQQEIKKTRDGRVGSDLVGETRTTVGEMT